MRRRPPRVGRQTARRAPPGTAGRAASGRTRARAPRAAPSGSRARSGRRTRRSSRAARRPYAAAPSALRTASKKRRIFWASLTPGEVSTPDATSTPQGRTRRIASATLPGSRPPASRTGAPNSPPRDEAPVEALAGPSGAAGNAHVEEDRLALREQLRRRRFRGRDPHVRDRDDGNAVRAGVLGRQAPVNLHEVETCRVDRFADQRGDLGRRRRRRARRRRPRPRRDAARSRG